MPLREQGEKEGGCERGAVCPGPVTAEPCAISFRAACPRAVFGHCHHQHHSSEALQVSLPIVSCILLSRRAALYTSSDSSGVQYPTPRKGGQAMLISHVLAGHLLSQGLEIQSQLIFLTHRCCICAMKQPRVAKA